MRSCLNVNSSGSVPSSQHAVQPGKQTTLVDADDDVVGSRVETAYGTNRNTCCVSGLFFSHDS